MVGTGDTDGDERLSLYVCNGSSLIGSGDRLRGRNTFLVTVRSSGCSVGLVVTGLECPLASDFYKNYNKIKCQFNSFRNLNLNLPFHSRSDVSLAHHPLALRCNFVLSIFDCPMN